jgi:4-hydroxybenzoate polyprenyltransferase
VDGTAARPLIRRGPGSVPEALEMIKFSHTVFALPFALLSAFRAANGVPAAGLLAKILLAMISARTAAMTFNRIADRGIDARNPRTAGRALPAGRLSLSFAVVLCLASCGVFLLAAALINPLARILALPTLAVLLAYSYSKRVTWMSHLILGLCLGIAPAGAWIAIRGRLDAAPVWLGLAVVFWTAGFDVLYALADVEVDRRERLFSLPARFGESRALAASALFHVGTLALLALFALSVEAGPLLWAGIVLSAVALVYQHAIVRPNDLSRLDAAFFTANGFVALTLGVTGVLDLWVR